LQDFFPTFLIVSLLPDTPDVVTVKIAIIQNRIAAVDLGIFPPKTISELSLMDGKIGFSLWVSSVSLLNALRFVFEGGKMLYIMVKKRKSNSARFVQKYYVGHVRAERALQLFMIANMT
jgi:hypothetical protein